MKLLLVVVAPILAVVYLFYPGVAITIASAVAALYVYKVGFTSLTSDRERTPQTNESPFLWLAGAFILGFIFIVATTHLGTALQAG